MKKYLASTSLLAGVLAAAACNQDTMAGGGNKKAAAVAPPAPSSEVVPVGKTLSPVPSDTKVLGCAVDNPAIVRCDPTTGVLTGLAPGGTMVHIATPTGEKLVTVTVPQSADAVPVGVVTTLPSSLNPSIATDDTVFACNKGQAGFVGKVYRLPQNTAALPNFDAMQPLGQVTALNLNVPSRTWVDGFPALPGLIEWFGIKFFAQLDAPLAGDYRFQTISDDGSKVYLDDKLVLDNDGVHAPQAKESGPVTLTKGLHRLTVEWFQGPRDQIALQLGWMRPGDAGYSFVPADVVRHGSDCTLGQLGQFP